jgi:hypothetical protein
MCSWRTGYEEVASRPPRRDIRDGSHCRVAPPPIHFISDPLRRSVHLFLILERPEPN